MQTSLPNPSLITESAKTADMICIYFKGGCEGNDFSRTDQLIRDCCHEIKDGTSFPACKTCGVGTAKKLQVTRAWLPTVPYICSPVEDNKVLVHGGWVCRCRGYGLGSFPATAVRVELTGIGIDLTGGRILILPDILRSLPMPFHLGAVFVRIRLNPFLSRRITAPASTRKPVRRSASS